MKSLYLLLGALFLIMPSTAWTADWTHEDGKAEFDRLDGKGASGKRVDVIEWEGNLEIHVYPAGSLKGLALKLDKKDKNKPVMVIGYRFDNDPKMQLIRRAILGIDLRESFKIYKDPSADEYDKVVISNNGLSSQLVAFKLDPEPRQLYPDGHPALAQNDKKEEERAPAAEKRLVDLADAQKEEPVELDESGTIQPFFMKSRAPRGRSEF